MNERDPIEALSDYYRSLCDSEVPEFSQRKATWATGVWQPLGGVALGVAATAALVLWMASGSVAPGVTGGSPILWHQYQSAGLTERDLPVSPKRAEAKGTWRV